MDYSDITEAANTPGDEEPLFGKPDLGPDDILTFPTIQNNDFSAVAQGLGDSSDSTIGTLSFTLTADQGNLTAFNLLEGGDYGFTGINGTAGIVSGQVTVYVFSDSSKTTQLTQKSASTSQVFSGPGAQSGFWSVGVGIDLSTFSTDEVYVVINNNLQAAANGASTAFIHKKQFLIGDNTLIIPEPASMMLTALGIMALAPTRRRRAA